MAAKDCTSKVITSSALSGTALGFDRVRSTCSVFSGTKSFTTPKVTVFCVSPAANSIRTVRGSGSPVTSSGSTASKENRGLSVASIAPAISVRPERWIWKTRSPEPSVTDVLKTRKVMGKSSLTICPRAKFSVSNALVNPSGTATPVISSRNASLLSWTRSATTATSTVAIASPAAKVTVPEGKAPPTKSSA